MSLADQLFDANQTEDRVEKDELGIPVASNVDYLVARAMVINQKQLSSPYTPYQLHIRGGVVFKGHQELKENYENLVKVTHYTGRVSTANRVMFWEKLKKHLPVLNTDIVQISEHLFWSRLCGKIITLDEIEGKYGSSIQEKNQNDDIETSKVDEG